MGALGLIEPQRIADRLEHRLGHAGQVAAFETHVVLDADAGQQGDLFAAQSGDPATFTPGGQADLLGGDASAP